jgi:hypothetical protein
MLLGAWYNGNEHYAPMHAHMEALSNVIHGRAVVGLALLCECRRELLR